MVHFLSSDSLKTKRYEGVLFHAALKKSSFCDERLPIFSINCCSLL